MQIEQQTLNFINLYLFSVILSSEDSSGSFEEAVAVHCHFPFPPSLLLSLPPSLPPFLSSLRLKKNDGVSGIAPLQAIL
jgi:hypothetical protein